MKIIVAFILFLLIPCISYSQKINTDAITKFWQVVDYLKTDKPLNDKVWNDYFSLTGNKEYMEANRSEENMKAHRKYLELLFRPSFADSVKTIEAHLKDYENDEIFQNLYFIKLNELRLRPFSKEIQQHAYFENSIKLAKEYLPTEKFDNIPASLTIYIMAMTYDAAVQDSVMYLGISCVYDLDRFQKGSILAHELHHILRINKTSNIELSPRDSATVDIINQINNEGCADLIDKHLFIDHESEITMGPAIKSWLLGDADNMVRKLDSCIVLNSILKDNYVTSREFREITAGSSGHIPGYYMVDIITRNGYMKELISNNDDPFNFFFLYNEAAGKDKSKPSMFSRKTIKYLKRLDKKLVKR